MRKIINKKSTYYSFISFGILTLIINISQGCSDLSSSTTVNSVGEDISSPPPSESENGEEQEQESGEEDSSNGNGENSNGNSGEESDGSSNSNTGNTKTVSILLGYGPGRTILSCDGGETWTANQADPAVPATGFISHHDFQTMALKYYNKKFYYLEGWYGDNGGSRVYISSDGIN